MSIRATFARARARTKPTQIATSKAVRKLAFSELEDRAVPAVFTPGSIQGQDGWSGGNIAVSTAIDQAVNQTGTQAHTGVGGYRISNNTSLGNYNGNFSGWVFGPGL